MKFIFRYTFYALCPAIACTFLFLVTEPLAAQSQGKLILQDDSGRSIWQVGRFRIFFDLSGEHAVATEDLNRNNVPDFVEDVAIQMNVAHHIYCDVIGFPDPLISARYINLRYIDVRIFGKSKMKGNGTAFDELSSARDKNDKKARSLVIYISRDINPRKNVTPAHEYFHQVQNGTSFFKNSWYYEGTARWAEDSIARIKPVEGNLEEIGKNLDEPEWLEKLYQSSYDGAGLLWRPLSYIFPDNTDHLPQDDPILQSRYTDGSPVMQDFHFSGAAFVSRLFRRLGEVDKDAFIEQNYDDWSEKNQRHYSNNAYIIKAVKDAIGNMQKTD